MTDFFLFIHVGSFGKFQIPPNGNEVDTCVAEGQTVYLTCDRGREIISHSAMSVLEIVCHEGKLDLWDAELCVPVKCDFPQDWMKFTGKSYLFTLVQA